MGKVEYRELRDLQFKPSSDQFPRSFSKLNCCLEFHPSSQALCSTFVKALWYSGIGNRKQEIKGSNPISATLTLALLTDLDICVL